MTNPNRHPDQQDPEGLRRAALSLIHTQYTMTLATAGSEAPWAAPVYYVYTPSLFYFFSDPNSRHIRDTLAGEQAAAAIFSDSSAYREIRGIQMSGRIRTIPLGREALKALDIYMEKFPFVKEMFGPGFPQDIAGFLTKFHVKLYAFVPHRIYYSDNRLRFGYRQEIFLDGEP